MENSIFNELVKKQNYLKVVPSSVCIHLKAQELEPVRPFLLASSLNISPVQFSLANPCGEESHYVPNLRRIMDMRYPRPTPNRGNEVACTNCDILLFASSCSATSALTSSYFSFIMLGYLGKIHTFVLIHCPCTRDWPLSTWTAYITYLRFTSAMCKYFGTKTVAYFYRHFDNCLESHNVVAASCPNATVFSWIGNLLLDIMFLHEIRHTKFTGFESCA